MEKDLWEFCMQTFTSRIREIRDYAGRTGGLQGPQMLDDLKDCVAGVKNLHRIVATAKAEA